MKFSQVYAKSSCKDASAGAPSSRHAVNRVSFYVILADIAAAVSVFFLSVRLPLALISLILAVIGLFIIRITTFSPLRKKQSAA